MNQSFNTVEVFFASAATNNAQVRDHAKHIDMSQAIFLVAMGHKMPRRTLISNFQTDS